MGLGWLAGPGAVLGYGVSGTAEGPLRVTERLDTGDRRSLRPSVIFTWCCHPRVGGLSAEFETGVECGKKRPHTPTPTTPRLGCGEGVPILEHRRRRDSALSGSTTYGFWSAVSERWIRFYENRIGSGWESPPWDQPKPVWVNSASFFYAEDGWEMVPQTTRCFGEEKSFQGACRKNNGSWSSVYPKPALRAWGCRRSPRFSRSRAERGEDNIINIKAGLGNANTLEVSNTRTPFFRRRWGAVNCVIFGVFAVDNGLTLTLETIHASMTHDPTESSDRARVCHLWMACASRFSRGAPPYPPRHPPRLRKSQMRSTKTSNMAG